LGSTGRLGLQLIAEEALTLQLSRKHLLSPSALLCRGSSSQESPTGRRQAPLHAADVQDLRERGPLSRPRNQQRSNEISKLCAPLAVNGAMFPRADLHGQAVEALCLESRLAVKQLVEDAAEAPDVALVAVGPAIEELRRHVERGANPSQSKGP